MERRILHPILHRKSPIYKGVLKDWCRKCRFFQKLFLKKIEGWCGTAICAFSLAICSKILGIATAFFYGENHKVIDSNKQIRLCTLRVGGRVQKSHKKKR